MTSKALRRQRKYTTTQVSYNTTNESTTFRSLMTIDCHRWNTFQSQGLSLRLNPRPDGNCQFETMADQLRRVGIYRSAETLRCDIVNGLVNHPFAPDDSLLASCIVGDDVDE
ncbi:hypothetical protein LSAT2_030657, partial [Lamellibrachia satsuma]